VLKNFQAILFLFLVSTAGFARAGEEWRLLPEKSKLEFMARSTFHDFNGNAQGLSGIIEQGMNSAKGFVYVEVAGLTTDDAQRDKNMYHMFDISLSPRIYFIFKDTDMSEVLDHHDGQITFKGVMTIRHLSHSMTLISKGHKEGNMLVCEGHMSIHLKDYGLKPPSILGLIRVNDEVAVWYKIVFTNK
jgi:polyisoprenoid-binding protein YceI